MPTPLLEVRMQTAPETPFKLVCYMTEPKEYNPHLESVIETAVRTTLFNYWRKYQTSFDDVRVIKYNIVFAEEDYKTFKPQGGELN